MIYEHTQIGYLIIFVLLIIVIYFGVFLAYNNSNFMIAVIMFIILAVLASFATLKVTINENYLRIKFGYGIFMKRFKLEEIISAKPLKIIGITDGE